MSYTILLNEISSSAFDIKQILLILSVVLVFYFFMIRPQQKKQKEHKSFLDHLKKGDLIITIGGIHGKLIEVVESNQTIVVEVDQRGTKISFAKSAIALEATKKLHTATKTS